MTEKEEYFFSQICAFTISYYFFSFHTAIHTTQELFTVLPNNALSFKLFAKVITGLKILVRLRFWVTLCP